MTEPTARRDAAVDGMMALVDAVMEAADEHESYGTPADPPESAMFAHQEHRAEDCPTIRAAVERVIASEREWADRLHKAVQHTLAAVNHTHGIGSCIGCVEAGEVMREYDERQRGVR